MADEDRDLTNSLLGTKQRGYGAAVPSTFNQISTHQKPKAVISHKLLKSDNLNSLAIQYDTTIGDIKRLNKLWNNESLAFRDTVDIPLYTDQPSASDSEQLTNGQVSTRIACHSQTKPIACASGVDLTFNSAANATTNGVDFFAKFDQTLSQIKKKVEHQTANSAEYLEDEDVLYVGSPSLARSKSNGKTAITNNSHRHSHTSTTSSEDISLTPEPVIRSKVKKKLEQHERRQDEELFTL